MSGTAAVVPGSADALTRLRRTRTLVATALLLRAALAAAAVTLALVLLLAAADLLLVLERQQRSAGIGLAMLAGIATLAAMTWRARRVRSLESVALWVEQRDPSLRWALLTLASGSAASGFSGRALAHQVAGSQWERGLGSTAARWVAPPLIAVLVFAVTLAALPRGTVTRVTAPAPGDALSASARGGAAPLDRLATLAARVTPPAYSGERSSVVEEPSSVRALVGSRVELSGRGSPDGIVARVGGAVVRATASDRGWRVIITMPASPTAVILEQAADGAEAAGAPREPRRRMLVLEPRADLAPVVTLTAPLRDSVLRAAEGTIPLSARATDDIGLQDAHFELVVSSGEGENFEFRSARLGAVRARGREAAFQASVSLATLQLKPGDIVHLRAVARDANGVAGPATGASETRTLRLMRSGELDSVAVEAAPPPDADRSALSQRMLIMMTEALERRRRRLERAEVLAESQKIARDQARLRKAVGELVFMRLDDDPTGEHAHGGDDGHDHTEEELLRQAQEAATAGIGKPLDFAEGESPVVAVNRPLLEAYNAMWEAGGELEQGQPARALPPMRRALEALQRARMAERIYLRGRPPAAVVDVARVRLAGKDKGSPGIRPSGEGDPAAAALSARFGRALDLWPVNARAATDSLLLLRIDALSSAPALAAALEGAIEAARRGDGEAATQALARARRALDGGTGGARPLGAWSSVPR